MPSPYKSPPGCMSTSTGRRALMRLLKRGKSPQAAPAPCRPNARGKSLMQGAGHPKAAAPARCTCGLRHKAMCGRTERGGPPAHCIPVQQKAASALLRHRHALGRAASLLFRHSHALGQIPRLVHVQALQDGQVVRQQLQGHDVDDRLQRLHRLRHLRVRTCMQAGTALTTSGTCACARACTQAQCQRPAAPAWPSKLHWVVARLLFWFKSILRPNKTTFIRFLCAHGVRLRGLGGQGALG